MATLLILGLPGWAHAAEPRPTDLELYAASSLVGLHSHPVGRAGTKLDRAERALNRRRSEIGEWLIAREGEAAVRRIDKEILEEVSSVYWTRGPSEAEERANIERSRHALEKLERRKQRAEGGR
jgi:hypothetical protein